MPFLLCSMLKKQTLRKLAAYFSAMVLVHGFLLWKARYDIASGLPDFSSFYTAAKMLQDGHGHQLYDLSSQEATQISVVPVSVKKRRAALPYNHPPFEAIMFLPLASFSYTTAYWVWFVINIGLLTGVVVTLRKSLPTLRGASFLLWAAACLSFDPIFIALIQGQDSILLLFCFCMVFAALRRGSDSRAGCWLGFALFKFQVVLPFMVPFFFLRRKAILRTFLSVAALLTLVGLKAVGWQGSLHYPSFVWALNHNAKLRPLVASQGTASLYGLISSVTRSKHPDLSVGLLLVLSAILLAISTAVWRRAQPAEFQSNQLAMAANLLIALLLGYHIWLHDLSVLFLAILLILEFLASNPLLLHSWAKRIILVCMAILFCSPITFVLLAYHKLYGITTVILVLLLVLVAEIFRLQRRGMVEASNLA
jgi:hypothetical protein